MRPARPILQHVDPRDAWWRASLKRQRAARKIRILALLAALSLAFTAGMLAAC